MSTPFSDVLPFVQILAGFATLGGFYFTYRAFKRVGKTEQIKLAEKINDSLLKLDEKMDEIKEGDEDAIALWDSRRLNTLEWYSFLVNEDQITDKKIQKYFEDAVISDFKEYFLENEDVPSLKKNDLKIYPELRKLYNKLTAERSPSSEGKQSQASTSNET